MVAVNATGGICQIAYPDDVSNKAKPEIAMTSLEIQLLDESTFTCESLHIIFCAQVRVSGHKRRATVTQEVPGLLLRGEFRDPAAYRWSTLCAPALTATLGLQQVQTR